VKRRHYSGRDPQRAQSIADLRAMALRRLPGFVGEYVEGGAEEEQTLLANRSAFAQPPLMPRMLRDVRSVQTDTLLLSQPAALPLAIAPTGYAGLMWPRGELALAHAAVAAGVPFCQSMMSNTPLAQVRAETGCRHWMQIYPLGAAVVERVMDSAARAGTEALVLTVDGPVIGNRDWDRRSYRRPFSLSARSLADMLAHPRWLADIARNGLPGFPDIEAFAPEGISGTAAVARWAVQAIDKGMDWQTCADMRSQWPGRFVIKGVMHPDDARRAVDAGADAVVLSNHGGRQLDGAPATIGILPDIVRAVGHQAEVYLDSGIRRGTDIVRACALGATGVLVGRAILYGLAAAGQGGVSQAIALLHQEMVRCMTLLGVTCIADIDPSIFIGETV
jgi:(S)-mandelate dehydrogenase